MNLLRFLLKKGRELYRQLDKNISACTDFAEHVCGKKQSLFQNNEETHYTNTIKYILGKFQLILSNIIIIKILDIGYNFVL